MTRFDIAIPTFIIFIFFFIAPGLAGCSQETGPAAGGGASTAGGGADGCGDMTGAWSGTWVSRTSAGTFDVDFTQGPGGELDGTIALTGTVCGTGGAVTGRIDAASCELSFGVVDTSRCDVSYFGTVEGDAMQGTFEAAGFGLTDNGTWEGARR